MWSASTKRQKGKTNEIMVRALHPIKNLIYIFNHLENTIRRGHFDNCLIIIARPCIIRRLGWRKFYKMSETFPSKWFFVPQNTFCEISKTKNCLKQIVFNISLENSFSWNIFYGFIVLPEKLYNCFFSDLNVSSLLEREDEPAIADDRPRRQSLQ